MTCDDYLSMLATSPVRSLADGRAGEHTTTCRECERVTRVVAEHERNMLMAFDDLYVSVPAGETAARALAMSRRRRISLYYQVGLGLAAVATVLFMLVGRARPNVAAVEWVSESFPLHCLSPDQAAALLRQFIEPNGKIAFQPDSPQGILRVEATPAEMDRARWELAHWDTPASSYCSVQLDNIPIEKVPPGTKAP